MGLKANIKYTNWKSIASAMECADMVAFTFATKISSHPGQSQITSNQN